jgi:hypothetical protein
MKPYTTCDVWRKQLRNTSEQHILRNTNTTHVTSANIDLCGICPNKTEGNGRLLQAKQSRSCISMHGHWVDSTFAAAEM